MNVVGINVEIAQLGLNTERDVVSEWTMRYPTELADLGARHAAAPVLFGGASRWRRTRRVVSHPRNPLAGSLEKAVLKSNRIARGG